MLKNYFLTSIRSLRNNTFFLLVNIIGISIAIAICIVGYFNFYFNDTFNDYFDNASVIYKANGIRTGKSMVGSSPVALRNYLDNNGFIAMRFHSENLLIKTTSQGDDHLLQESLAFVDEDFLNEFHFYDQSGNQIMTKDKNSAVISSQTAIKLFGSSDPKGKLFQVLGSDGKQYSYQVYAVMEKLPENISFQFSIMLPIANYFDILNLDKQDWNHRIDATFIKLPQSEMSGAIKVLNESLIFQKELPDGISIDQYRLDNLSKWPEIESQLFDRNFRGHLHPASVLGTVSSAIAILLLACFNFVNTSIAVSGRRLKEIGLRKVFGGSKAQIICQFMFENALLILAGIMLSILVSIILIPSYNALFEFEIIEFEHVPWSTFALLGIGLLLVVTQGNCVLNCKNQNVNFCIVD